ncbi:MAG: DUF799 family lipoprotein [Deltaproteobacteria bacterium]|nr:MAG: DUF799 family lipoprotein [Deltaproteobacteria bacterium]
MIRLEGILKIDRFVLFLLLASSAACGPPAIPTNFHDPEMDFAALRTVAVMPFENLTRDQLAGERVRNTFFNSLLATGAVYVIPSGEVARGVARAGIANPASPSIEEIVKLAGFIKVDALITGVVQEYGEVRSGTASANVVSVSAQMVELQTRKVVWAASTSKGGITIWDRLFGSGGRPMNEVTRAAVDDLIDKLFD